MIRRATSADAAEVSRIFVATRDEMTYLPRIVDEHRPLLGRLVHRAWPDLPGRGGWGGHRLQRHQGRRAHAPLRRSRRSESRRRIGAAGAREGRERGPALPVGIPEERGRAALLRAARVPTGRADRRLGKHGARARRAVRVDVRRIADGLWYWTAPHPRWRPGADWPEAVGCVYYEASDAVVLIDPLLPRGEEDEFLGYLDRDVERLGLPVVVLLTAAWHLRSSNDVSAALRRADRRRAAAGDRVQCRSRERRSARWRI